MVPDDESGGKIAANVHSPPERTADRLTDGISLVVTQPIPIPTFWPTPAKGPSARQPSSLLHHSGWDSPSRGVSGPGRCRRRGKERMVGCDAGGRGSRGSSAKEPGKSNGGCAASSQAVPRALQGTRDLTRRRRTPESGRFHVDSGQQLWRTRSRAHVLHVEVQG